MTGVPLRQFPYMLLFRLNVYHSVIPVIGIPLALRRFHMCEIKSPPRLPPLAMYTAFPCSDYSGGCFLRPTITALTSQPYGSGSQRSR